ncbi:MAG: hypothetical protein PF447_10650 [Spirochaetaceae bacterium]|jgi:hypothetical protein|nr:hypothetical protein [Spirochaetaceae bacterium]
MKRIITLILLSTLCLAAFAEGKDDVYGRPGYGARATGGHMMDFDGEPQEILEIEGTLELNNYGHYEILLGNTHYMVGPRGMEEEEIQDLLGKTIVAEGFEGPVVFTKGDEEFAMFMPLAVTVDGETISLGGPHGMGFGGPRGGFGGYAPYDDDDRPCGGAGWGRRDRGRGMDEYWEDLDEESTEE